MTGSLATTSVIDKPADPTTRADVTLPVSKTSRAPHTEEQSSFQPGSTPANQKSRYLVSS